MVALSSLPSRGSTTTSLCFRIRSSTEAVPPAAGCSHAAKEALSAAYEGKKTSRPCS
jgi:hypothetical protein